MPNSSATCRSGRGTIFASSCWRAATARLRSEIPDEVTPLSDAQIDVLGEDYNTPIHLRAAPEVAERAVNERTDRATLTAQFEEHGAIAVDNLLTPSGARLVAAVLAGEHDLARLLPYRRFRCVLSGRWARLSAASADRGRTPAHASRNSR